MSTAMNPPRGILFAVARVTLETTAPLAIGSGHHDDLQDSPFATDAGGHPCIPATGLAGILRRAVEAAPGPDRTADLFGVVNRQHSRASRVETSVGLLHDSRDRPVAFDGLDAPADDPVLGALRAGILRDHVALDLHGVAMERRKYDRSMVPSGARFSFELVVHQGDGDADCLDELVELLAHLHSPATRMGSRTRSGLGAFAVADGGRRARARRFDLREAADRTAFADYRRTAGPVHDTRCLAHLHPIPDGRLASTAPSAHRAELRVDLVTDDLLHVGGGDSFRPLHAKTITRTERSRGATGEFGEVQQRTEVRALDRIPYSEPRVVWTDRPTSETAWGRQGSATLERVFVVPASALKGALRHRTLFHLSRLECLDPDAPDGGWAESVSAPAAAPRVVAGVASLFGFAKGGMDGPAGAATGQAGRVSLSDIVLPVSTVVEKQLDHVSLDRFTGGARARRLFSEVVFEPGLRLPLELAVDLAPHDKARVSPRTWTAFVQSVRDLCEGLLPIGAASSRGHGTALGTPDPQQWSAFAAAGAES